MTLPNPARRVAYNWIAGSDGAGGGTLISFDIGDSNFITDITIPNPTLKGGIVLPNGSFLGHLPLPSSFPRQAYIVDIFAIADGPRHPAQASQLYVALDQGGAFYNSGTPPGSQNGNSNGLAALLYAFFSLPYTQTVQLPYPVLLNRDAGDKLLVDLTSLQNISSFGVQIGYLVPA